jgi:hypothetical protein
MCESRLLYVYLFVCSCYSIKNDKNNESKNDKSCKLSVICSSTFYINMKDFKKKQKKINRNIKCSEKQISSNKASIAFDS